MSGLSIDGPDEGKFFRSVVSIFVMCLMGIAALIWWQGCNNTPAPTLLPIEEEEVVQIDSVSEDTAYLYIQTVTSKLDKLIPYEGTEKTAFIYHVASVTSRLDVPTSWWYTVSYHESRLHYRSANVNESGDTIAYGLFQWTHTSCAELGISLREVIDMTLWEQIELSYTWLSLLQVDKSKGFDDFYLANYLPYYRNKPDSYEIDAKYVASNPIGNTIGEFRQLALRRHGKINQT